MNALSPGPGTCRPESGRAVGVSGAGGNEAAASWRWALSALILGLAAVLVLYRGTVASILNIWRDSPAFSHGYLIVPIVTFLMWRKRRQLMALTPRPSVLGLLGAAAAALAWLVGDTASVQLVQQFALVAVLQGLFIAVLGLNVAAVVTFPLFYLYFAIPLGASLIAPLQDLTAVFIVRSLHLIGMPVHLDGIFIHIPTGSFVVAEACAGLRFLVTSIALGMIFAYVFYRQLWRRVLFVALSVAVPIVANGFRATGIVLLAHYSDYRFAAGADHITYGLVFLSLVLLCLMGIGYTFGEPPRAAESEAPPVPAPAESATAQGARLRIPAAAAAVVTIVAASAFYAAATASRPAVAGSFHPLAAPDAWQDAPPLHADWKPKISNPSQEVLQGFRNGAKQVDAYVAYFARQSQAAEAVNWSNSVAGALPWQRAGGGTTETVAAGQTIAANTVRIVAPGRARIVWYWYWVDGRLTVSPYLAKIFEVKAKLLGGEQAAALVALAADYRENPQEARQTLSEFVAQAWPLEHLLGRADDQM